MGWTAAREGRVGGSLLKQHRAGVTQAGGRAGSVVESEVEWGIRRDWETGDRARSSSSWVSTHLHHLQAVRVRE